MITQKNKLLILLLLAVNPIFSKNLHLSSLNKLSDIETTEEKTYFRKSLIPIFILGTYNFGIIQEKSLTQILYNSYFNLDMELHGNLSFAPHLYRAFIYMRLGGRFSIDGQTRLTFSVGFSGYIYDGKNKSTQLGWSILLGGGVVNYLDFSEKLTDSGIEIILRNQYNFHKYMGIVFGLSFEYLPIVNSIWSTFSSTDKAFLIGVSVGLAF